MQITTTELVARAKAIADMHDNFVTPDEWMYWARQERLALDYLMARSGWTQAVTQTTVTTTGAGNYTLTMPLAVVAVYESSTQGLRRLRYNNAVDFAKQVPGSTLVVGPAAEYSLRLSPTSPGSLTLNFFPEPAAGGTYLVAYIPLPNPLALTATTGYDTSVVYPMGWEERIVVGMAKRALVKEESDTSAVDRMIAEWNAEIERAVTNMVLSEAPRIRDTDTQIYGWDRDIYYPPSIQWRWF